MATRIRNKLTLALSLAVMLALLLAPLAFADNTISDGDGMEPVDAHSMDFGTVCAGSTTTQAALVRVNRNGAAGSTNVFKDGSTVIVSVLSVSGTGLSSAMSPQNTITLPSNWGSLSNNSDSDYVSSDVTFVAGAAGSFSGSVSYRGSGVNSGNNSINRDALMTVTATIMDCAPSDATPPEISYVLDPASPDGDNGWYKSNVTLTWTVTEDESPDSLVKTGCVDQDITADQPATTYSCSATSDGGSAGPVMVSIKRDATAPTLDPSVSPNPVLLNGSATASPNANDATSGVASSGCDPVDTSSVGSHTVQCFATDNAGNTATDSVSYTVNYNLCVLYDQTKAHKSGSTVPIKLQLCDVNGMNYSASSIVLMALGLNKLDGNVSSSVEDSGNANPDYNFRYDPALGGTGGYIYNLSTKGLTSGTWKAPFAVDGVASSGYSVEFDVK
jgi:hypothetical protein